MPRTKTVRIQIKKQGTKNEKQKTKSKEKKKRQEAQKARDRLTKEKKVQRARGDVFLLPCMYSIVASIFTPFVFTGSSTRSKKNATRNGRRQTDTTGKNTNKLHSAPPDPVQPHHTPRPKQVGRRDNYLGGAEGSFVCLFMPWPIQL